MIIEKFHLVNIQAHKDTTLEFHKGVNVIKGRSHGGKTTIVRGAEWVAQNRPTNKSMIRWGTEKEGAKFIIDIDEDREIIRHRSTKENGYRYKAGKYSVSFEALRGAVPDDVTKQLNLSSINIQTQHERHFLLQNTSPGEVAKRLNEIIGLQIIDNVTSEIKSITNRNKSEIKETEQKVSDDQRELEEFKDLDKKIEAVDEVKKLFDCVESIESDLNQIQEADKQIGELEQSIKKAKEWLEIEDHYTELNILMDKIQDDEKILKSLMDYDQQIEQLKHDIKYKSKTVVDLEKKLKAKLKANKICPLCGGKVK
mgnify:CR=1 FL=1|jgi:exonuclease SbcC